jgi:AraC-like DNA-binding protein
MKYNFCRPAPNLQPFIDGYYRIAGQLDEIELITLLPEGGVNLFVNLGECIHSNGLQKKAKHGEIYLVGPMMKAEIQTVQTEVLLLGVQFKPGAFFYFHKYDSLDRSANTFREFPTQLFPDVKKITTNFSAYLDQFYLRRLSTPKRSILNCVSDIRQNIGSVSIEALAKRYFTTERQLERQFKEQVGLSPKKFIDLLRFRKAFVILSSNVNCSIQEIAWDCGYYDHAHMTNDFKRFTGQPPTAFILSDISKVIATEA